MTKIAMIQMQKVVQITGYCPQIAGHRTLQLSWDEARKLRDWLNRNLPARKQRKR